MDQMTTCKWKGSLVVMNPKTIVAGLNIQGFISLHVGSYADFNMSDFLYCEHC